MTAISITEVTAGSLEGTGAFDKIMSAMQIRLEEEFSQGRITGDDYANVYLGAMTASMQQAVAFVLGKQTADSQAELTKAQALEVNAQTANVIADTLNKPKQGALLTAQANQADKQTALVVQQKDNLAAESINIPKQGEMIVAQTALVDQQKTNAVTENSNIAKQGVVLDKQAVLVVQQATNLAAEYNNIGKQGMVLDKQALDAVQATENKRWERVVLERQAEKILTEKLLLKHKSITEEAQYSDNVESIRGQYIAVSGVIGKQRLLYKAQTDGFARDAEQKLAKIMADTWNIRRSTDSTLSTANTGLADTDIKAVLNKAKSGINA